jgi:hypothetical protein
LKQLDRVGLVAVQQGEHLRVEDAGSGGKPLHVAVAEARRGAERVGVVDEALARERHRLEATMRVLGKARHAVTVVHAPPVFALEVHAQVAACERGARRAEAVGGGRVVVAVVDAEEKRVVRLPGRRRGAQRAGSENHGLHDG